MKYLIPGWKYSKGMHMLSGNNLPNMFNNFAKRQANILISKYKPVVYDIGLLEVHGFRFFVYLHMASSLLLLNRSGWIHWVRMLLSISFRCSFATLSPSAIANASAPQWPSPSTKLAWRSFSCPLSLSLQIMFCVISAQHEVCLMLAWLPKRQQCPQK